MPISKKTTRLELAAIVTEAFHKQGMSVVLVGGAVVSLYTNNKYESYDLDFISPDDHVRIAEVMASLGFKKVGKNFEHPQTVFFVEFPAGPLAIGNQAPVEAEGQMKSRGIKVSLLSPTQCVMDRLAAWFHWNDTQSLEQAIMVAQDQPVKLSQIKKWSEGEGQIEKYERFLTRLRRTKL